MATNKDVLRQVDDEARSLARELMRATPSASLATIDGEGLPFCSLTSVGTDSDGSPVILVSRLSTHTGNLLGDGRVSLLFARAGKGDPLAHPRLTVLGRVQTVDRAAPEGQRIRSRFLARQPKAELYVDFPDFLFVRIRAEGASLNGGFGKAYELGPVDLLTDLTGATALLDSEPEIIAHMNEDHRDAVKLYATRLAGKPEGPWRLVGCDPDGVDLANGTDMARLAFGSRVTTPDAVRMELVRMSKAARQAEADGSGGQP